MAALQLAQQVEDLRLHGHVQRRGRFIRDQQGGVAGQRHGDHGALPHPARQLVRIAVDGLSGFGDADLFQKVNRLGTRPVSC